MSAEAAAVWRWIQSMKLKSGEFVNLRAFNAWCAKEYLATAGDFIAVMDELVRLGYLVNRDEPGAEKTWNYWVA